MLRATKLQRKRYQDRLHRQKMEAALCIQSYFRMSHVRSIFGDVTLKLASIQDLFAVHTANRVSVEIECDFKELDDTDFILDDSFMDFDLHPLSNPVRADIHSVAFAFVMMFDDVDCRHSHHLNGTVPRVHRMRWNLRSPSVPIMPAMTTSNLSIHHTPGIRRHDAYRGDDDPTPNCQSVNM